MIQRRGHIRAAARLAEINTLSKTVWLTIKPNAREKNVIVTDAEGILESTR